MVQPATEVLEEYDITAGRGFLPESDPLRSFEIDVHDRPIASYLREFDRVGAELPGRLEDGSLRPAVRDLEPPPDGLFEALSERETVRLCLLSGFFASAYVNDIGADPVDRLPAGAAVPLYRTSQRFGRKPILSYDMLCLHNWQQCDRDTGFDVENLDTVQQFTSLSDERWFVVIHVAIEARAGPALTACARAQQAVRDNDPDALLPALETIGDALEEQTTIMARMTENNDPEAFARNYRPYYNGFDEVVYEGVDELEGTPQTMRGGSGAQSSVLPSIDAVLGVDHAATDLIEKLIDMRSYMPETHRSVIAAFDEGPDVGPFVADSDREDLRAEYNRCMDELGDFRRVHFSQVAQYINEVTGDTTGTGGTDYMDFLPKLKKETESQKI
ncbi:indoleamine 2,3-dioxygenase [Natronosalvus halobius]|uniref:indoleamine 2,3-dioxygenase n=1 Tax=Natronosalvus halobius TaxID=2953746 RepID=UPI0020A0957F|nr:indoleamine 2,3-dioxygenase [Natronosalvus halobius]USZ73654.1 indoleamine 2,3-dioxygenase [Natronosalvus halobius]